MISARARHAATQSALGMETGPVAGHTRHARALLWLIQSLFETIIPTFIHPLVSSHER